MSSVRGRAIGADVERRDARAKACGEALFAYEVPVEGVVYAHLVQARVARGGIAAVEAARALALPGVLTVISHENAPRLKRLEAGELFVLQEPRVAYFGQVVAAVVAETLEIAREAAELVEIVVEAEPHDVTLRADHAGLYRPEHAAFRPPETRHGDVDAAVASAPISLERTYTTPAEHNMPMEPHSTTAIWEDDALIVYESTQFPHGVRAMLAADFQFFIGGSGGNHACAEGLADFNGGQADTAGRAQHQHGFAGLELSPVHYRMV